MDNGYKLNESLRITHIDENNVQNDELIAVICYFTFYGHEGEAYVCIDRLDGDNPSYAMIESGGDLHDSFVGWLEDHEVWDKLVVLIKKFHEQWKIDNL